MPASFRFQTFWSPAIVLVLATLLVFGHVLGFGLVNYDDPVNITENPWLQTPAATALAHFWSTPYEELYVPLTYTAWYFLGAVAHMSPAVFHAANWLVHALNAVWVFAFLRLCLELLARRDGKSGSHTLPALAGAFFWALHPLQAEPVSWVTGFKDVWGGFFAFGALLQYARFCAARMEGQNHWPRLAGAFLLFILALLAKPSAVVLPLVAWIFDVVLVGHKPRAATRFLAPSLVPAVIVVLLTKSGQQVQPEAFSPLWGRPFIAADALAFYAAKIVAPFSLGLDYGRVPSVVLARPLTFALLIFPLVVGIAAWKTRRHRWPLAAVSLFLLFLLPVLGFVPFSFQGFSTVADRYVYLALLGPALGLAALVRSIKPLQIGVWVFVVACAILSFRQSGIWQNSISLNENALVVNPNSPLGNLNLASALAEKGDQHQAGYFAQRALEVRPGYQGAAQLLEAALAAQNRPDDVIPILQKGTQVAPDSPAAFYVLGRALRLAKRQNEAKTALNRALELKSDYSPALNDLALIYLGEQRFREAAELLARAVDAMPNVPEPHATLAFALEKLGQNDFALAQYRAALAINPFYTDALGAAMQLLSRTGRTREAVALLEENIEITDSTQAKTMLVALLQSGVAR